MGMIYAPPSVIPNGALINGVCHIYQSTKPTARSDGSALVVGDKWYNASTAIEGFWNGTYWLNVSSLICGGYSSSNVFATMNFSTAQYPLIKGNSFFIGRVWYSVDSMTLSGSDSLTLNIVYEIPGQNIFTISVITFTPSGSNGVGAINSNIVVSNGNVDFPATRFNASVSRTGSATYGRARLSYELFEIL